MIRRNNAISDIESRLIRHPHGRRLQGITWTRVWTHAHEQEDKVNIAPSRRRRRRREYCWGVTVARPVTRSVAIDSRTGGGKSRGVRGWLLVEGRSLWLAGRGPAPRWRGAELMAGSVCLSIVRHGPYLVRAVGFGYWKMLTDVNPVTRVANPLYSTHHQLPINKSVSLVFLNKNINYPLNCNYCNNQLKTKFNGVNPNLTSNLYTSQLNFTPKLWILNETQQYNPILLQ